MGAALLLCFTACLYLPVRRAGFVYDDQWYVVKNPGIRDLALPALVTDPSRVAAPESGLATDVYRPFVTASFALDYHLWRYDPLWFHLENLFLHLFNGFLVWMLFRRLLVQPTARLLALAVFLLHPVQVESVAWISQRSTLLSSAGMLVTLLLLDASRPPSWGKLFGGWLAYSAALGCRETAVGTILALALIDGLRLRSGREESPAPSDRRWFWTRYAGLILLTGVYGVLRSHAIPAWSQISGPRNWHADAALGALAFATYLGKLLCPIYLRIHYAYPAPHRWLIGGAVLIALLYKGIFWRAWFRRPRWAAALMWIFIFLVPVLQFLPIRAFAAERFLYFSLIGLAWLVGLAVEDFPRLRGVLGLVTLLFAVQAARQVPAWDSEQTVWAMSVRQDPHDAYAHAAYGSAASDPRIAEEQFRAVLAENPTESIRLAALVNLSALALRKQAYHEAADWAIQALALSAKEPHALYDFMKAREGLKKEGLKSGR